MIKKLGGRVWTGRPNRETARTEFLSFRVPVASKFFMTADRKPTHTQPGGFIDNKNRPDDLVVNDSLGTVDPADSTGSDESKETGDAKVKNKNTRED
jgi:hypothetical protein